MSAIFSLHFASTCFMVGVIWFVQVVHYPLFASFDTKNFAECMKTNQFLTTFIVGPAMLIELCTAIFLVYVFETYGWMSVVNLGLLALIWLLTFLISVPLHSVLASGFDAKSADRLVSTNWWRTILWSTRFILLLCWGGL